MGFKPSRCNMYNPRKTKKVHLNGRCSAAVSSAYLPLDIVSLLKPIFSYNFPKLNFPVVIFKH